MDDLSAVLRHYESIRESERLTTDSGPLEHARTQELIARFLAGPPLTVLDVGGGTGVYAAWLGGLGYQTHLIDLVPGHVEEARALSDGQGGTIASCAVGDARELNRGDESMDAVLLMGPLYHLPNPAHRLRCLSESFRVLRPGGVLFAAAISRHASVLDGLRRDMLDDPTFQAMVERDVQTGVHNNPTDRPECFTTAYLHLPSELGEEVRQAGFLLEGLFGVEGPGWLLADFSERWADERSRETLLWAVRRLESEPAPIGVSAHLLAVGRKPV